MNYIDFEKIEQKYKKLISIAKEYMKKIQDYEHNIYHMYDVVSYTKELINHLNLDIYESINLDVCIISAYWHDVGRIKINEGHEKLSAEMLKQEMVKLEVDNDLIDMCYKAIEKHKWNMTPETTEGLIIKDADKLAWLGLGRWKECLNNHQNIDLIVDQLYNLKENILYFEESKKIYDIEVIKLIKFLYSYSFK